MSRKLNAIPIDCDAPAYPVVHACRHAGFNKPEDVRWRRLPADRLWTGMFTELLRVLHTLSGLRQPPVTCACGAELPAPGRYQFTCSEGQTRGYVFTQCKHCHTMHWDEFTA